jgi:hypothetical protein
MVFGFFQKLPISVFISFHIAELQDAAPLAMGNVDLPILTVQGIRVRPSK